MKTVLVLGIAGFSGRHFERFAARKSDRGNYRFVGIDRDLSTAENSGVFEYLQGDVTDQGFMQPALCEFLPSYVLNLVGRFRAPSFSDYYKANLETTRIVCEGVVSCGIAVEKIVVVGSAAEYGFTNKSPVTEEDPALPITDYGLTKLFQTELAFYFARNRALPILVARTFNIFGEGLSSELSVGYFMRKIAELPNFGEMKVGNLSTSRDFLEVEQVVAAYWTLLQKGMPGQVYNVCSGRPTKMEDILKRIIKESGKSITYSVDPVLLKQNDVEMSYGSNKKLKELDGLSIMHSSPSSTL
jgi:GDP-4-dehydro-6-deoxy-D-mannose reductase